MVTVGMWGGMALFVLAVIYSMYQAAAASLDITTFTMVTSHFQFCYLFMTFPFYYPAVVKNFGSAIGLASGFVLDILAGQASPRCLTRSTGDASYVAWWAVDVIVPVVLIMPFWAAYSIMEERQEANWKRDNAKAPDDRILSLTEYRARRGLQDVKKRSIKTILMILVFALVYGVRSSVKVWHCAEYPDGSWRLPHHPSIECSSENAEYTVLLALSIVTFCIYFFGSSALFFFIAESSSARKTTADNFVTHARWLRDVGFWEQIDVFLKLLWYGSAYGDRMERTRLHKRLKTRFHITQTCVQIQKLSVAATKRRLSHLAHHEREKTLSEKAEMKAAAILAIKRFETRFRMLSHPKQDFFMECFPVRVLAKFTSDTWLEGICHGVDEDGLVRVATGEGTSLSCDLYENGFIVFEHNREVLITSDMLAWTHQEGDAVNAVSAAPLGAYGRMRVQNADDQTEEPGQSAEVSIPPSSHFSFFLDLSQPIGFDLGTRWNSIVAKGVVLGGQSYVAGMVNNSKICRVGGTAVVSAQAFELAIVKRRVVSALLRREKLAKDKKSTATPLSEEDEALLANDEAVSMIKPPEMACLAKEFTSKSNGGRDTFCTLTFDDPRYVVTRRLPADIRQFSQLATMRQPNPYWCVFSELPR